MSTKNNQNGQNSQNKYTDGWMWVPPDPTLQNPMITSTQYTPLLPPELKAIENNFLEIRVVANGYILKTSSKHAYTEKTFIFNNLPDLIKWIEENISPTEMQTDFLNKLDQDLKTGLEAV